MNKTKAQDGTSPKEKEILKKRLEVLFKKHDKSFAGGPYKKIKKVKPDPQQVKETPIAPKNKLKAQKNGPNQKISHNKSNSSMDNFKTSETQKSGRNQNITKNKNISMDNSKTSETQRSGQNQKITKNKKNIKMGNAKNSENSNKKSNVLNNPNSLPLKFQKNSTNPPKSLQNPQGNGNSKKNKNKISENQTTNPEANPNTQIEKNATQKKNKKESKIPNTTTNEQPIIGKNQKKKAKKQDAISDIFLNSQSQHPSENGQPKLNKNQKKKAKKRAAAEANIKSLKIEIKKQKFNENFKGKKPAKKLKVSPQQQKSPNNSTSHFDDECDINMTGFVKGGDFDSNYEDYDDYEDWMNAEDFLNEDTDGDSNASNIDSDEDYNLQSYGIQEPKEGDMEKYENEDSSIGSEEEFFDDSDYEFSDLEEDENYSDFDEDDYEEDEDSYNYGMDSDGYSTNYDNEDMDSTYDFNDGDYNLPEHVLEDMIIHSGTATKRDIKPEDNISFDNDCEGAQIIELEEQRVIKDTKQPKAYEKEELLKLKYEEKTIKAISTLKISDVITTNNSTSNDTEDCPKLVPIVDEDGFQLYNPNEEVEEESDENYSIEDEDDTMDDVSLGSEYMEINSDDADSMLSEDINEKYLNRGDDEYSDSSVDDRMLVKQQVDVIDATRCKYENDTDEKSKADSDVSLNDDIKQIPSLKLFKNINLDAKSSILSTTIIDDELLKTDIKDNRENQNQGDSHKKMEIVDNAALTSLNEDVSVESISSENDISENACDSRVETSPLLDQDNSVENISSENDTSQISQTYQPTNRIKTTNQNITNFNTKFYNALDSNLVLVLLNDPFYIYGTVRLTLLAGKLDVYGHSLSLNTEVEIFSPRGCSVIEIASTSETKTTSEVNLKEILKTYETNFALADLRSILDTYEAEKDAVLLLKRNESRKKIVQQFKKFMNENVFPNINNINMDRPLYNSEYLLRCMINTSAVEQKCLRLPKQWQQLEVTQHTRVMLSGGKGVGKSTLLRFLINRHLPTLKEILLVDLDIGQPEIFVPQTVSCSVITQPLLGPGFLLNLQPEKSYAVGHTNIALCAHKYLEAVRSLISYCLTEEKYKGMPWLINTMGYNKGFGLELIAVIAKELPLTDVVQLQSTKNINNFDSVLYPHVVSNLTPCMFIEEEFNKQDAKKMEYRLHVWQSAVQQQSRYQKEWDMSAKDLRYAMLLARLSEALQGQAEWLTDCKPLCAPLDQLKLVHLMENAPSLSQEELAKAAEANLVYLCHYEDDKKPMECLGIGVVRAIDVHVNQLYLLPAMSASLLKNVNCLALGEMPLPTSIFTNQGSRVRNLAPFVYNTIAANASKAIKQIYHRPRKFLTGKHKSLV